MHYVDKEDFNAHDILLCINTGETQATPALREFTDDDVMMKNKRFAFPNNQFYLKNTSEMLSVFDDLPHALDNTNEVIDKIEMNQSTYQPSGAIIRVGAPAIGAENTTEDSP